MLIINDLIKNERFHYGNDHAKFSQTRKYLPALGHFYRRVAAIKVTVLRGLTGAYGEVSGG
jgi:hypothetical protein